MFCVLGGGNTGYRIDFAELVINMTLFVGDGLKNWCMHRTNTDHYMIELCMNCVIG